MEYSASRTTTLLWLGGLGYKRSGTPEMLRACGDLFFIWDASYVMGIGEEEDVLVDGSLRYLSSH